MKSMRGKTALWGLATAFSAAMALGSGQNAQTAQNPQSATMTDARGEQILNQSCSSCHELRNIETQALDADGWTKLVNSMIEKGSSIKKDDVPGFVVYLVRKHGPLPEGAGKRVMLEVCTQCHELDRIRSHTASRDEWEATLLSMLNEGAPLSDEDFPIILNYLTRNFRPKE
jgi:mono/diheme cytochrome c family protein